MDPFSIFMVVALFGIMYFMLIRPAQKKTKEQQQLVSTIQPGARIMTGSGIFGTVRHVGERQAIIEISPGVEMTVAKQAIMRTIKAEDDEFEYADDADDVDEVEGVAEDVDVDVAGDAEAQVVDAEGAGREVAAEDTLAAAESDPKR